MLAFVLVAQPPLSIFCSNCSLLGITSLQATKKKIHITTVDRWISPWCLVFHVNDFHCLAGVLFCSCSHMHRRQLNFLVDNFCLYSLFSPSFLFIIKSSFKLETELAKIWRTFRLQCFNFWYNSIIKVMEKYCLF